jgi:hypothetical protein
VVKSSHKIWVTSVIYKKTSQNKQSPIMPKFGQSGRPDYVHATYPNNFVFPNFRDFSNLTVTDGSITYNLWPILILFFVLYLVRIGELATNSSFKIVCPQG